jgi:hypothetical protein
MGLLESSMEVLKLAGKIANPELVQAATKANIEALELSTKNLELQKSITDLDKKVAELEAKLVLVGEVFRKGDFVYRENDPDPYCSRCWDVDRRLVHIMKGGLGTRPTCPQCKTGSIGNFALNPHMGFRHTPRV